MTFLCRNRIKCHNSDKMEKRMSLKEKFWTGSGEEHSQFPLDSARSKPGCIRRRILFPLLVII